MNVRKLLEVIGIALILATLGLATARADEQNQDILLTFNQPVQIPGNQVLPAGSYWFHMVDTQAPSRTVVSIYSVDHSRLYATLPTISVDRSNSIGRVEVVFANKTARRPYALVSWFYPGRLAGHEFVYSNPIEKQIHEGRVVTRMAPFPNPTHNG